jgi:hypothetical protein
MLIKSILAKSTQLIHKQDTKIAELCKRIEKGKHQNNGVFTEADISESFTYASKKKLLSRIHLQLKFETEIYTPRALKLATIIAI